MAVPEVSHRNWWLTQANAQVAMGNHEVDTRDLSFQKCIELIGRGEPYRDLCEEQDGYTHTDWSGKITVAWEAGDRSRPHRPTIDNTVIGEFEELVNDEWPNVPVEGMAFDKQLSLFLKRRHEWLKVLDNDVVLKNTTTDETAALKSISGSDILG
jgi:hypothetical protein